MGKKDKNQQKINFLSNGIVQEDLEIKLQDNPIGTKAGQNGIWLGKIRGIFDTRNDLNDLTGKEWIQRSKSVWISERCVEDKAAFVHPAPFLIRDISKLITLFTKKDMLVLDPFVGSGTTMIAAAQEKRNGIGLDLSSEYLNLAVSRLNDCCSQKGNLPLFEIDTENDATDRFIPGIGLSPEILNERKKFWEETDAIDKYHTFHAKTDCYQVLMNGDANDLIGKLPKIDYCVTSPPYHNILRNVGQGVRHDGSQTRQGVEFYSDDPRDLGNQPNYKLFIKGLGEVFRKVFERLREGKYCTIVISDFTVDKVEMNVHGDIIQSMMEIGFVFVGTIILVQDSKILYPFGYPYQFKINHTHQYLLNFLKKDSIEN